MPIKLRATLYFIFLLYLFLGIAIIADIFMSSIETITSKRRKIRYPDPGEKDKYLTGFATKLCQDCFQFCLNNPTHPAFENSLDLFTRLLNSSTSNSTEIITKLAENLDSTSTIPEVFYLNYARPLITVAIEQHRSLDHIVDLTIQVLNTFDSSETIVERVLADLIKVGPLLEKNRHSNHFFSLNHLVDSTFS